MTKEAKPTTTPNPPAKQKRKATGQAEGNIEPNRKLMNEPNKTQRHPNGIFKEMC